MKYSIGFTDYSTIESFKNHLETNLTKNNIKVKIIKIFEKSNQNMKWLSVIFEGKPLESLKLVAVGEGYGSNIESINSFTTDDFRDFSAGITN